MFTAVIFLIASLSFASQSMAASAMATLASSLRPGNWGVLSTTGIASGGVNIFSTPNIGGHIFEYGAKGVWDTATGCFIYRGTSHHGSIREKQIKYCESTNTWTVLTDVSAAGNPSSGANPDTTPITFHSYDHQAVRNGKYFHRPYTSGTIRVWDTVSQTWEANLSSFLATLGGNQQCCGSLEYFPDYGANGSLIFIDGDWGIVRYAFSGSGTAGSWSKIYGGQGDSPPNILHGSYTNVSGYSPKKQMMVFGGGSGGFGGQAQDRNMYKLSSAGVRTQLNDVPCQLGTTGTNQGFLIPDPITGNFLILCHSGPMYMLNPDLDTYTNLNVTLPFTMQTDANLAFVPLHHLGVIMFIVWEDQATASVHLYKPDTDWVVRSTASGVIRAFNFDATVDFPTCGGGSNGCYGSNFGIISPNANGDYTKAIRDTSVRAGGASSLRFTIPTNSGGDMAGSWHTNFSADLATQFGGVGYAGGEFYIQWQTRFSSCYLKTGAAEPCTGGARSYLSAGGWKQVIIGTGDLAGNPVASCTVQEVPIQNTNHLGFPQAYHHCGDYLGFDPSFNNPNIPGVANDDIYLTQNQRVSPYCSFEHFTGGAVGGGYFPPGTGTCFPYFADEWMTFQVGITVGPYQSSGCVQPPWSGSPGATMNPCYKNSRFRMWLQRENGAEELVADHTRDLRANNETNGNNKYGKIWLTPYNTNKSAAESHPEAYTWYDNLIISTTKIAAPGAVGSGLPAAPSALRTGQVTTSGRVTIQ